MHWRGVFKSYTFWNLHISYYYILPLVCRISYLSFHFSGLLLAGSTNKCKNWLGNLPEGLLLIFNFFRHKYWKNFRCYNVLMKFLLMFLLVYFPTSPQHFTIKLCWWVICRLTLFLLITTCRCSWLQKIWALLVIRTKILMLLKVYTVLLVCNSFSRELLLILASEWSRAETLIIVSA